MNSSPPTARSLFLAAIENHPTDQWDAFLDDACAADPNLRRGVADLLRAHAVANRLLDAPETAILANLDLPNVEQPGTMIGPYKLIEQIGEGGMGLVFMAEQTQPVRRKVA